MTQEEIAKHLGISQQSVSRWFNGKSAPKGVHLVKLSKLLGKDTETVLKDLLKKGSKSMIDPIRVSKYSDKILDLVDNQEGLTRSDLQGAVEALVMGIIAEIEAREK